MSKFDFPRLPRHEIIEVLSAFVTVSEADLRHPDPDFIRNLYTHILLQMEGPQEEQDQMEFGALEQLDIPDYHVHSAPLMDLYSKIQQLVAAVDCPKAFLPKDLIKPESDRTEIFLSALLNFQLYRESKLSELKPIGDELELFQERKQDLEARISQLNDEIAECEELRENELPLIEEISSKVKELNQSLADLNKHQMKLKTSVKELNDKGKEMDEKISNAEYALVQSAQENASLRSKIVQSPDKLQRALEEKRSVQIQTKNAERETVKSFHDKTATLEAYDKACKKMSKHFAQMQAVQEQANQAKSVEKDVKVLRNKLSDEGILDKSLEAKMVELKSKADQLKELKKQLEKEISHNNEEATTELTNVKFEVESKKQDLVLRQKEVESVVAEAEVITSKKRIVKENGEAKVQKIYRKCEEIVAEFNNYSKSIGHLLPAIEPDSEARS